MTQLERFFLVTDFLFPAKTARSERAKLFHDLGSLSPELKDVAIVGRGGYLDAPQLLPASAQFVSDSPGADALLIDRSPEEAAALLVGAAELPPLVIVPIAFQKRHGERPFYSAMLHLFEARGYSLFNLYNVQRKGGQIHSAYALFLDHGLRERYVQKISL